MKITNSSKRVSVLIIFIIALDIFSQGNSTIDIIRKKYGPKSYVDLNFDLTIFWSVREKYEKKSGELLYAPGDNFRLKLGNSTWVSNGQTYWQYSSRTNQVVIKSLLDIDLSMQPSSMMKNFLKNSFKTEISNDKEIVLSYSSAEKKSSYKKITITINSKKMEITELLTVDNDGNESRYNFKKIHLGVKPDMTQFEFTTPEGADVLDTRK